MKSLFAKRSMLPHIAAADYIYKADGIYKLKRETKWNYKIQGEIAFSRVKSADLVICINKGIMVIDVPFDVKLWDDILVKLNKFYFKFLIPELLTQDIFKRLKVFQSFYGTLDMNPNFSNTGCHGSCFLDSCLTIKVRSAVSDGGHKILGSGISGLTSVYYGTKIML